MHRPSLTLPCASLETDIRLRTQIPWNYVLDTDQCRSRSDKETDEDRQGTEQDIFNYSHCKAIGNGRARLGECIFN